MKATFTTSVILHLMFGFSTSRGMKPVFRLQNFLVGKKDWKTRRNGSLHIGEQYEFQWLHSSLGAPKWGRIWAIHKKYNNRAKPGCLVFPSYEIFKMFIEEVKNTLGPSITLVRPS